METHVFNEATKRLEPLNNVCVFCGQRYVNNANDNCYLTLYKEKSRTNVLVYRNVKFSKIAIGGSRCPICKQIHYKIKIRSALYSMGAFILGLIPIFLMSYFLFRYITILAIIIGIILLMVNVFLTTQATYYYFERKLTVPYDILTPREGLQVYPIVQELINDGFTFDVPVA